MADDEVLDQGFEFVGEAGNESELGLQHFQFDDHVAEKLAAVGIGERTVVGQLVNLADVEQERAGEKKIAVHLGIVPRNQIAGAEQRDDVVEQAADVGVMERLGGRSIAVCGGDFRIGHEGLHQRFEMRILDGGDEVAQGLPQLVNVFGGLGQVVGKVNLGFAQFAQLVDGELEAVLVLVDQALDLEEIILFESLEDLLKDRKS